MYFQDTDRRGAVRRLFAGSVYVFTGVWLTACYSFAGGGGLPDHMRTVYVAPVDNQSTQFGLAETLSEELLRAARQRLGLRLSSEQEADAIITATIRNYQDAAVNFDAVGGVGANVFQRRVTISASVEILDVANNVYIWSSQGLTGAGEYEPGSETEEQGSIVALENLVQQIVDGAQSQW